MRTDAVDNIGLIGAEPLEMTADNVLALIEQRKYVTFVELHRYFRDFEGELDYGDLANNVVYWSGISHKVCDILDLLVKQEKIYAKPTIFFTYLADGGGIRLPIAKRIGFKYKTPRWLPIVWNPISLLQHESKKARENYRRDRRTQH